MSISAITIFFILLCYLSPKDCILLYVDQKKRQYGNSSRKATILKQLLHNFWYFSFKSHSNLNQSLPHLSVNIKAPSNWCVSSQPNLGDSEEAPQAPGNSRLNPIIPHSLQPSAQVRGFQSALILYDPQLSYDDNFGALVCSRPVTRKQLAQIKLSFK